MSEVSSHQAGTPAWVDLTTSDPAASRRFYGELFGWEFQVGPADTGHYTTCLVRGHRVAGIAGDPAPAGTLAAWATYLASGRPGPPTWPAAMSMTRPTASPPRAASSPPDPST